MIAHVKKKRSFDIYHFECLHSLSCACVLAHKYKPPSNTNIKSIRQERNGVSDRGLEVF